MRYRKQVSANVRAQIAYHDMTQIEAAAIAGVSQAQFSKRLHGQIDWRLGEIVLLANRWKMEPTRLLAGIDNNPLDSNGAVEAVTPA